VKKNDEKKRKSRASPGNDRARQNRRPTKMMTEAQVRRLAEAEARRLLEEEVKKRELECWATTKRVLLWGLYSLGGIAVLVVGPMILRALSLG
jgi:hypothetical protein